MPISKEDSLVAFGVRYRIDEDNIVSSDPDYLASLFSRILSTFSNLFSFNWLSLVRPA